MKTTKVQQLFLALLISLITFSVLGMDKTSFLPHQFIILDDARASFWARIDLIRRATKSINLEYYIFENDITSQILVEELILKAKEGVEVKILLDNFRLALNGFYAPYFKKHGIKIKVYNRAPIINFTRYNHRNHRKILSIDGEEVIVGGRNIGDEYFGHSPKFNFYDRDLLLKGPIVKDINISFENFWQHKLSVVPKIPKRPQGPGPFSRASKRRKTQNQANYDKKMKLAKKFFNFKKNRKSIEIMKEYFKELGGHKFNASQTFTCHQTQFLSDWPGVNQKNSIVGPYMMKLFKNAQSSVLMETPYFITLKEDKSLLSTVLNNNVNIKLLTNSLRATDAVPINVLFNQRIHYFIKRGLKAYIFTGEQLDTNDALWSRGNLFGVHAKTYVIDNNISAIGPYNYDPRSKNINAELNVICHNGPKIAQKLTELIEQRIEKAIEMDAHGGHLKRFNPILRTSFIKKVMKTLAWIPANIFDYLL